jgi:hypothetical protein
VTDHDPVAVGSAQAKLAHVPGLIGNFREEIGSQCLEVLEVAVGIFDAESRKEEKTRRRG